MREPTYFVLASLLDGPLHGYAIIKRTAELSGDRVNKAGMAMTGVGPRTMEAKSAAEYLKSKTLTDFD